MRGRILRFAIAVLIAALVVALSGLAAGCSSKSPNIAGARQPVHVGAILSLTGTYAALGGAEKNALLIEQDRINAAGGLNGRPLEIIIEDDGTEEARAVVAAQKLIYANDVVAIIGGTGTGSTMAIRQLVQEAGIPQISLAGGSVVTEIFSPNVYQTPWHNRLIVGTLFAHLKERGFERVALVSDAGSYGKDGRAMAVLLASNYGIDISVDVTFNPGDTDMAGQVAQIMRDKNVEAVVLWSAGKEAPLFIRTARLAGLTVPLFGGSGQAREEFVSGAGEDAEGYTIVTGRSFALAWDPGSDQLAINEDFADRYESEWGARPDIFAGHAFDAITLFGDAYERAGDNPDGAALIAALDKTTRVVGYAGSFTFSPSDHNGLGPENVTLLTVSDGKFVPLDGR